MNGTKDISHLSFCSLKKRVYTSGSTPLSNKFTFVPQRGARFDPVNLSGEEGHGEVGVFVCGVKCKIKVRPILFFCFLSFSSFFMSSSSSFLSFSQIPSSHQKVSRGLSLCYFSHSEFSFRGGSRGTYFSEIVEVLILGVIRPTTIFFFLRPSPSLCL